MNTVSEPTPPPPGILSLAGTVGGVGLIAITFLFVLSSTLPLAEQSIGRLIKGPVEEVIDPGAPADSIVAKVSKTLFPFLIVALSIILFAAWFAGVRSGYKHLRRIHVHTQESCKAAIQQTCTDAKQAIQQASEDGSMAVTSAYGQGEAVASQAFTKACDHAERIRDILKEVRLGRAYFLQQAEDDLFDASFTFVFGKLSFLIDKSSDDLLKRIADKGKWTHDSLDAIALFVPDTLASAVASMCRHIQILALAPKAFARAEIVFVDSRAFEFNPVQLVMYARPQIDGGCLWNADVATKLVGGERHYYTHDSHEYPFALSNANVEIVAFLDDLVTDVTTSMNAGTGTRQLADLIGLVAKRGTYQQSLWNVFKLVTQNVLANDAVQLMTLLDLCGECSIRTTACANGNLGWQEKCDVYALCPKKPEESKPTAGKAG